MKPCKRVLLKISGEALGGGPGAGLDPGRISFITSETLKLAGRGVEVAVVLGGGNFIRGGILAKSGFNRETSDHMGMISTVVNALAFADRIESLGSQARVCSAFRVGDFVEPYILRRAVRHLEKGRIVILCGGTGNPHFTTDTAAALRAAELGAGALLKATKVDGVYDSDPVRNKGAVKFESITFTEVLARRLEVMDLTAMTLCMEKNIPVIVFDISVSGNMEKAAMGEKVGTLVTR